MERMEALPERDEAKFDAAPDEEPIVRSFYHVWYGHPERTWHGTYWFGVKVVKCAFDLWVYQEILHQTRPDVVVETGTAFGGSAYYMASIFDLLGHGRIVTVDIAPQENLPPHPRITYITGDSIAPEIVSQVKASIGADETVMVILDSAHNRNHVLAEMRAYGPLVREGQYLIAEDTHINLSVPQPKRGPYARPGPLQAVWDFVAEQDRFVIDRSWEKFFLSFNPSGYLRCVG
jgi:cephalosporin hydroxylase